MNFQLKLQSPSGPASKGPRPIALGLLFFCLTTFVSTAQTYRVLHSFSSAEGYYPASDLVASGSTLYGNLWGGCAIFKINSDGTGFEVLGYAGVMNGGLALSGTTLYGVIESDSIEGNRMTVFSLNTDGSGYHELYTRLDPRASGFATGAGALTVSGNTLYGTTGACGHWDLGRVFKLNTDGTGFTVLKEFAGPDGAHPSLQTLVLSDSTLHGTTEAGGQFGFGTAFKLKTDGTGYTVLKHFAGADGEQPRSGLVLAGDSLYGTTYVGGSFNCGTLYKLNTDGSGFVVLKAFDCMTGGEPEARPLVSGSTVYGTTSLGGPGGGGSVFRINTDGSGYTVLKDFYGGSDGAGLQAGVQMCGNVLFGTTLLGGAFSNGLLFSLSMLPPTLTETPQSQTAELGSSVILHSGISGDPVMTYQWFFNDKPLGGPTTAPLLDLGAVQFTQSGTYSAVVTNLFGQVTSPPALLNVVPRVERRPVLAVGLSGQPGSTLHVETASALGPASDWREIASLSLTSPPQFFVELAQPLPPRIFYRARQAQTSTIPTMLDIHFVPAITVAGSVGTSVRLDCINQFGSIDAWVTLATISLTNTSQLYFDTSSIDQPPRLYRLVPVP